MGLILLARTDQPSWDVVLVESPKEFGDGEGKRRVVNGFVTDAVIGLL